MRSLVAVCLTICGLMGSHAEVNISSYIYWKMNDINNWHQFFPSRYLKEEQMTISAAVQAVSSLSDNLRDSLRKVVVFQYQEQIIAEQLMAGTGAEGCLNGISKFLDKAIDDEIDSYHDCTLEVPSRLGRFLSSWNRVNSSYYASYQRSLAGMDACAKTYPNKDSVDRLKSCFESMTNNYFLAVNNTQASVFPSPSMSYFQSTVVQCASNAAQSVAAKGSQFLKMLVNCAALSGTVDPTAYAEELSQWKGYNDTLNEQIDTIKYKNYYQIQTVEEEMKKFYLLQKQVLDTYVIESRGLDYYLNLLHSSLGDYFSTLTTTSLDNPGEPKCLDTAKNALVTVVNASALELLNCDQSIVSDMRGQISDVYKKFQNINNILPTVGNVATLSCISQGYVYFPDTIERCFQLASTQFDIDYSDTEVDITNDRVTLAASINSFFNNPDVPCGSTTLRRVSSAADNVLYDLQRCLYLSSGSTYEVTTPRQEYTTSNVQTTYNTATQQIKSTFDYKTSDKLPKTSTNYPHSITTQIYNTTTELYNTTTPSPFNITTTQRCNETTILPSYNTTTELHNTTTPTPYYNSTTQLYNTTTILLSYNTTTELHNTTTPTPYYNSTTQLYNTTTILPSYNTTTELHNTTTPTPYYNTTTQLYNTTTILPIYNTTSVPTEQTTRHRRRKTTTPRPYYDIKTLVHNTTKHLHNTTTPTPYYNTTTQLYNTTTILPIYNTTSVPTEQTTQHRRRKTTTPRPRPTRHTLETRKPVTI